MNLNQLKYIILNSSNELKKYEIFYGEKYHDSIVNLYLLKEIHNILMEEEWYQLPETDKKYLYNIINKIILRDKFMIFEVPSHGIYINWGASQTSTTFDLL